MQHLSTKRQVKCSVFLRCPDPMACQWMPAAVKEGLLYTCTVEQKHQRGSYHCSENHTAGSAALYLISEPTCAAGTLSMADPREAGCSQCSWTLLPPVAKL